MKAFLKKNKGLLILLGSFVLLAGGWLLLWQRLGRSVERAAYDASYEQLVFSGAYYHQCDLSVVQEYLADITAVDDALCGEELGTLSFPSENGTVSCPLYACKPLTDAGKKNALVLLRRAEQLIPYELIGFQYLDDDPSIWAVCASYGLGRASDLESVTVTDTDGGNAETLNDPEQLQAFYDKFVKLGEDIGKAGQAKAYYDAYTAKFGKTDKVYLEDDTVKAVNDAAYQEAMDYWMEGMRLVTIRAKNGYQLRGCVYAPVPEVFSVYGDYPITEPFFEEADDR